MANHVRGGRAVLLVVCAASGAASVAAQEPQPAIPDSLWALCPADDLPRHLLRLAIVDADTQGRAEAAKALAAMGPRAHRWLFGGLRLPTSAAMLDVAAAFGAFGPASAWAMPGLLELVAAGRGHRATLALLERLGSSAKPAVPLLRRQPTREANELADRLDALAESTRAFEPMPAVAPVDAAWRPALLAVLRDPAQSARWWPAVQALLGIDVAAAVAAAEVLVVHAVSADAAVSARAGESLFALRCYHAADALGSLDAALALPPPHREWALHAALLANSPPLEVRGAASRADAQRVLAFAASASPVERRLAALSSALHVAYGPVREPQRFDALAPLLADGDATTRALAAIAARASDVLVERRLAVPSKETQSWSDFGEWEPQYLRRVPPARLAQALATVVAAGDDRRRSRDVVVDQVLRANELPASAAHDARSLLAAVAAKAPELLAPWTDGDEPTRRVLTRLLANAPSIPPALCEWWLDQQKPAIDRRTIGDHLPLAVAPTLLGRLRRGERLEHTLALLHTTRSYVDWHEIIDRDSDAFAGIAAHVPATCLQAYADLLCWGPQRRRVAEQLLLDARTATELRPMLVRGLGGGNDTYPPSDTFVLACLRGNDAELAKLGYWIAGHARGSRDEITAVLLERLPKADENAQSGIVRSLGKFGSTAAHTALRERLHGGSARVKRDAAIALASSATPDAEALAWLRAGIAGDDVEERRQVWRWIAFSTEVAPLFVDEAVERLAVGGDIQSSLRLQSLLTTAAETRRDEVLRTVTKLTRHVDEEIANIADNLLQQLSAK